MLGRLEMPIEEVIEWFTDTLAPILDEQTDMSTDLRTETLERALKLEVGDIQQTFLREEGEGCPVCVSPRSAVVMSESLG